MSFQGKHVVLAALYLIPIVTNILSFNHIRHTYDLSQSLYNILAMDSLLSTITSLGSFGISIARWFKSGISSLLGIGWTLAMQGKNPKLSNPTLLRRNVIFPGSELDHDNIR